ncbi:hypothetical protein O7634_22220 [Micromonospora sp. WMMD1120]|uniref:hypothetical protein n=1 Tax=Micromonospora sp. WMMD1120 TaxID=3016106 RepID=UPI002416E22F|nr:hypothetical protein [Micromonospora sp. WMMD1120]MDG4809472.1 hypothetical protein [Micromonospora sp. WMMD1120]
METDGRARLFTIRTTDRANTAAVLAGAVFAVLLMLTSALASAAEAAPAPSAAAGKFYVVGAPVDGQREFLFAIAAQTLGDGKRYREIFDLNRGRPQPDGRVMNDPTIVEPGWILLLPDDARGPGVRTGPLPSVAPPSDLPSASAPAATAGAQPEAHDGGISPSLLATVAGLLLAALAVPLLLRRSRRVAASIGPTASAAGPAREPTTATAAPVTPSATTVTATLPQHPGPSRPEPVSQPPVTTRPSAAPVASLPPATAGPDTPPPTPPRLPFTGPPDAPAAPPPATPRATPATAVPPTGAIGAPPTGVPPTEAAAAPGAAAPDADPLTGPDRHPPATAPTGPPVVRVPEPPTAPAQRQLSVPVAPRAAPPRASEPQPPAPQPAARPAPTPPQTGVRPQPATQLAAPQPVSPPPVAAPRPVTPLTPTTPPQRVSAPLASARPTPLPAPRPAADDPPASTARLIPVESPQSTAEPTPDDDRETVDPAAATPAPVVTGLRRAIALPTGDLQRVAGIGSLAATAPGWFPPLVTDLDTDSIPMTVRLVGARPARWGSAYGWLEEGWHPPPSTVPVVLGEHDGRRLWVDLAAAPDVLTLGGDPHACQRLGVRLLAQLAPTVDVVVVDDALGGEPLPERCRRLGSVDEVAGLDAAALRVVFCPGTSAGILWRKRRSFAASAHRTVSVVVGDAPPARWSVRAMAEGRAS